jgi:uncharacterized protein YdaU (DUF1376 family)
MHYYTRNLGDYYKKTSRLSIIEHGVYNLLIDACYDREQFPTRDEAIDWVGANSDDELKALDKILRLFFYSVDGVYVQDRIEQEFAAYREKCNKNKEIGRLGGRPKNEEKTTVVSEKTNVVQKITLTNNHKPITHNHSNNARMARFDEFWSLYPKKTAKEAAKKAWVKINDEQKTKALLTLPRHINTWSDPQFIPHPATWINQHRFDDVLTTQVAVTAAQKDYVKPKETESEKEAQRKTLEKLQSMVSQKVVTYNQKA